MSPTDPAQRFERHRAKLFALAYRMLGSGTDAEDILQEAALRFLRASAEAEIAQPEGWLVRVVSRLCVDELRRARRKREVYVGPYLPEPEPDPRDYEPFDIAGLSMALLAMMERLSPRERVAFVLHDAFDYGHDAIASVLEVNASNARQILRRARKRLGTAPRFAPSAEAHRAVLMAFAVATQTGDTQALTSLLAEDVSVISDGGGKVPAATRIVSGRERAVRFILGLASKHRLLGVRMVSINGQPALVARVQTFGRRRGDLVREQVFCIETDGIKIFTVFGVLNPDKLSRVASPPFE